MTHLVRGVGRKILAVVVRCQYDASRRIWVFGRDDVRKVLWTIRCRVYEGVLLYVPFELAECGNDVIADKSVVFGVGYMTRESTLLIGHGENVLTRSRNENFL